MIRIEIEQRLPPLRSEIFDIVCLVENHVLPAFSTEYLLIVDDELIRRYAYMPCIFLIPPFPFLLSLFGIAVVCQDFEPWSPFLEFHFPVKNDASWNDDEMGSPYMFLARQMRNESNR